MTTPKLPLSIVYAVYPFQAEDDADFYEARALTAELKKELEVHGQNWPRQTASTCQGDT